MPKIQEELRELLRPVQQRPEASRAKKFQTKRGARAEAIQNSKRSKRQNKRKTNRRKKI